jgi:hypothetical protein
MSLSTISGIYICFSFEKTDIVSWTFQGAFFIQNTFVGFSFSHIQSYLYCFILLILKAELKGSLPNNTIAPLGFMILFSCSRMGSKGITVSRLQAVVQYGGSVIIQSILQSGISFMPSIQSIL